MLRRFPSRLRLHQEERPRDPLPRKVLYEEVEERSYGVRWAAVAAGLLVVALTEAYRGPSLLILGGVAAYNLLFQLLRRGGRRPPLSLALLLDTLAVFGLFAVRGPAGSAAHLVYVLPLLALTFAYGGGGAFAGAAAYSFLYGVLTLLSVGALTPAGLVQHGIPILLFLVLAVAAGYGVEGYEELIGELLHHSVTDPLTTLFNRRFFTDSLERVRRLGDRQKESFALVLVDVKGFKQVNDTQGHEAGDHVLVRLADHLLKEVRLNDIVARIGGDEFAILLPATALPGAGATAQRLVDRLAETDPVLARIGLSVGVAGAEPGTEGAAEAAFLAADRALIAAKQREGSAILVALDGEGKRLVPPEEVPEGPPGTPAAGAG